MEEIRNIERLHSFMNELQNECVVKANVEEFLRICLDIIYDGERITKRHPYFTKPTAQERIKFSEFLLLPFVKSKIDKIDEIGKLLEKEYELFNENIDSIIFSNSKYTLLENKTRILKNLMIEGHFYPEKHNEEPCKYIKAILSAEMNDKLLEVYNSFKYSKEKLLNELRNELIEKLN